MKPSLSISETSKFEHAARLAAALAFVVELAQTGEVRLLAGATGFEGKFRWPPRHRRGGERGAGLLIRDHGGALELLLQRRREEHALGKFTQFHVAEEA